VANEVEAVIQTSGEAMENMDEAKARLNSDVLIFCAEEKERAN